MFTSQMTISSTKSDQRARELHVHNAMIQAFRPVLARAQHLIQRAMPSVIDGIARCSQPGKHMIGMLTSRVQMLNRRHRQNFHIVHSVLPTLAPLVAVLPRFLWLRERFSRHHTHTLPKTTSHGDNYPDRARQALNLLLAVTQVGAIIWNTATGAGPDTGSRAAVTSPVFPAPYTFAVWVLIYIGALAYAVYQALPGQRTNPLLRRIGWWTASAFLALTLWAVFQIVGWLWLTVVCIFWMFGALLVVFTRFTQDRTPRTRAERILVVLPLSIFLGYITAATILTIALVVPQTGLLQAAGIGETAWSNGLLLAAGLLASALTWWSQGNVGYALTIIWALVGIVVANVAYNPNPRVAITAASMAVLVAITLMYTRELILSRQ